VLPDRRPERIRQSEQELAEEGIEERVVVAVEAATGFIVGATSMVFYPNRPEHGFQNDTSAVGDHRGHGLGVAMEAAMMRWVTAERPTIELVLTTTGEANKHMIDVNLAVAYRTVRSIIYVESSVGQLAKRLDGADD